MDDFKKKAEQARLARMQGIKVSQSAPKRNLIEDALGQAPAPTYTREPQAMPNLKRPEPVYVSDKSYGSNRAYGTFLKKFFLGLIIMVLLAVVGFGGYAMFENRRHPKAETPQEVIAEVGKLIALPQGETPSVATISDLKPLEGQEFFKDAQVGDKVLVFDTAKKAVLYRPSEHKVINVAPLGSQSPQSSPNP